ncbi:MAG: nicotinate phosphoribosyltransferase [Pirellulaceae bacterium]|nr:MAG: nicotinate phosphoribosyltransferase [Pirellulaceae bacterium]
MDLIAETGTPLLTDLYQLTMAYAYWHEGRAEEEAVFHQFFRSLPFRGGYAIAAGIGPAAQWMANFRFRDHELEYLSRLRGNDQRPLFAEKFLHYLRDLRLTCDVDAVPEGTAVFPLAPMVRVQGPILQCQLLETGLLNLINFPTLVATKAARIREVAGKDDQVLEFGLRRAQGPDGAVTASRAAFVGGCDATSNVLAGMKYDIPVKGTHAHSWVMAHDDELEAFRHYAAALPNNCVFLVDTYDTLEGVRHACIVGEELRARGHRMVGIRLDSGDLDYLSKAAREILDAHGFHDAVIVASNELDEATIESLKHQGAPITVWGVGTRLATSFDQPALGGVYKLGATRGAEGQWRRRIKISEQTMKTTIPGVLGVRRFTRNGMAVADMIYDLDDPEANRVIYDPGDPTRRRVIEADAEASELLQPLLRDGKLVGPWPSLEQIQQYARRQVEQLHPSLRRLLNPHGYPVGLSEPLYRRRLEMIEAHQSTS